MNSLTTTLDFAAADALDRRLYGRSSGFLLAFVDVAGASYPVSLRNISRGGALIESEAGFVLNSAVTFRRSYVAQLARIVWCRGGRFGLVFDLPIAQEDVDRIKHRIPTPVAASD